MDHNLELRISLLNRTPAALDALLRGLPEELTHRNEGDGTWTVSDVIGHLIHCEHDNWIARAKWIIEFGESRPFEAFNRFGQQEFCEGKSLDQLLDEFCRVRIESLSELRALNLRKDDLERSGLHPALGTVTLSQLLATWAAHDLTHLHQISRIMAYQYKDMVGPWNRFLGVMHCNGHSAAA